MSGSVKKIDTEKMNSAMLEFMGKIKEFEDIRNSIDKITDELLSNWIGKSRDAYEVQYKVLNRSIKDIEDSLYDLYDEMVEAAATYIENDAEVAKAIEKK